MNKSNLMDLINDYGKAKYSQGVAEQRNANESEILRYATEADELLAVIDRRIDRACGAGYTEPGGLVSEILNGQS